MLFHRMYHTHPPHKEDSIRLLRPAPGSKSDPLCAEVCLTRTTEYPEYCALSYVWGDPQACDRHPLRRPRARHPGQSVRGTLLRIRSPTETTTLWVDAVCINQGDLNEREHQVSIMRNIYQNASLVLSYLGPGLRRRGGSCGGQRVYCALQGHFQ